MKNLNDIREGILILAVINFITAFFLVAVGINMLSLADFFRGTEGLPLTDPTSGVLVGTIGSGTFFLVGLLVIALGLFFYFIGRGLIKRQNWARIAMVTLAVISAIIGIMSMIFNSNFISGLLSIGICGLEIWYLLIKESTKKYFK